MNISEECLFYYFWHAEHVYLMHAHHRCKLFECNFSQTMSCHSNYDWIFGATILWLLNTGWLLDRGDHQHRFDCISIWTLTKGGGVGKWVFDFTICATPYSNMPHDICNQPVCIFTQPVQRTIYENSGSQRQLLLQWDSQIVWMWKNCSQQLKKSGSKNVHMPSKWETKGENSLSSHIHAHTPGIKFNRSPVAQGP